MANRKRWYAELAGTILLWVEEAPENPNNPPFAWRGTVLRRPLKLQLDGPETRTIQFSLDAFFERSAKTAMEGAEKGVSNSPSPFLREYAHRIGELKWREWEGSDEEWDAWKARFMADGRTE